MNWLGHDYVERQRGGVPDEHGRVAAKYSSDFKHMHNTMSLEVMADMSSPVISLGWIRGITILIVGQP